MAKGNTSKSPVIDSVTNLRERVADEVSAAIKEEGDADKAAELVELVKLLEKFRRGYETISDSAYSDRSELEEVRDTEPGKRKSPEEDSDSQTEQIDRRKEEEYPVYGLEEPGGEIHKVGYGKNGLYIHRATRENLRRVIRQLEKLREQGDEEFSTNLLRELVGNDVAKSQLYVILGLLQQEDLIDKPKRGTYEIKTSQPITEQRVEHSTRVLPEEYRGE